MLARSVIMIFFSYGEQPVRFFTLPVDILLERIATLNLWLLHNSTWLTTVIVRHLFTESADVRGVFDAETLATDVVCFNLVVGHFLPELDLGRELELCAFIDV